MKILTVVGARPQFIKAASISRAIQQYNEKNYRVSIKEIILHTGQHYDKNMSDIFFSEMKLVQPDYHLKISGSSHGAMTGQMIEKIEQVIFKEKPDVVMVYGDTNSTLAGSLAAVKQHIPIAHVEAGLRSFNMNMPEEINRLLTDQISSWLFCPSEIAVKHLDNEGFSKRNQVIISNVGDVMYDAILFYRKIAKPSSNIASLIENLNSQFYLATVHRAENTDNYNRLSSILTALDTVSQTIPIVLPLHPRTGKLIASLDYKNLRLIEPVGYFDMITLLSHCNGVFTDSGGLQKEAFFFHKPCVTLRDETEWVELVEHGFNILTGADINKILQAEKNFIPLKQNYSKSLYGDGKASQKIVDILAKGYQ